ncbi:MAG: cytochrome b [Stellaceae bacterium]
MLTIASALDGGAYDRVARATHWLVAALVVIVVSFGWASEAAPRNTPARDSLLLLHRSLGLVILALVVFRMLWRLWHRAPPLPATAGHLQRALAHLTQSGLDAIFLVMPLAGYVNAAAAGHSVSLFGLVVIPPLLPTDERLSQFAIAVHLVGQYLVYLLVALHVTGALHHALIRRDHVLDRMLPPRRRPPAKTPSDDAMAG